MDNFPNETGRKTIVDQSGLNSFLSKMYGIMTLAVLVSALSSFLTMTVFAKPMAQFISQNQAMIWLLLLLPFGLTMGISFKATIKPIKAAEA